MSTTIRKKTQINKHVLDLFLSIDFSEGTLLNSQGEFVGYRKGYLEKEAAIFLSHLHSLEVSGLPDTETLVLAFHQF